MSTEKIIKEIRNNTYHTFEFSVVPKEDTLKHSDDCNGCKVETLLGELETNINYLRNGLNAICRTSDFSPWITIYKEKGGGYEGLQAIAEYALKLESES